MNDLENCKQSLIKNGFYIGNISDIFPDMDAFNKAADTAIESSKNKESNGSFYMSCIGGPEGNAYPVKVQFPEIQERQKIIEENNFHVDQQWWDLDTTSIPDVISYFNQNIENFVSELYPEVSKDKHNFHHQKMLTLYEPGDYTKSHSDGNNPGRLCVFLIYLSKAEDYNDGAGKLIINDDGVSEEVLPLRGNYAILDFKNHNIRHEVETIKNNFLRYAYVDFVSNINEMNIEVRNSNYDPSF
jgi:hypothetical protein